MMRASPCQLTATMNTMCGRTVPGGGGGAGGRGGGGGGGVGVGVGGGVGGGGGRGPGGGRVAEVQAELGWTTVALVRSQQLLASPGLACSVQARQPAARAAMHAAQHAAASVSGRCSMTLQCGALHCGLGSHPAASSPHCAPGLGPNAAAANSTKCHIGVGGGRLESGLASFFFRHFCDYENNQNCSRFSSPVGCRVIRGGTRSTGADDQACACVAPTCTTIHRAQDRHMCPLQPA